MAQATRQVELPAGWSARNYQLPLWRSFTQKLNPKRRGVCIWPRRAGKDRTALAITSVLAARRPAVYWHMLPTNVQARKVLWEAVDRKTGRPLLDIVFPEGFATNRTERDMCTEIANGSRHYCVGSDNYDRLVGTDPFGVIFSEYSLCHPDAWEYIRPILAENGGWALFLYTPRGRNHGWHLYNMAAGNPDWFCELLTTEETQHVGPDEIDAERRAGMPEEMIQQEFYCSFSAGAVGAYWGKEIELARKEGRITKVPYDPQWPVELWFDLGFNDATAVWAMQPCGTSLRAIRYQEFRTMGIPRICEAIRAWGYRIDLLRLPHDGDAHEQTSGRTKREMYEDELKCTSEASPRARSSDEKMEQINGARVLLNTTWFDATTCSAGLASLESYCRKWDERNKVFLNTPLHDWSSHGADAYRTGAVRYHPEGSLSGTSAQAGSRRVRKPRVLRAGQTNKPYQRPIDWSDPR